MSYIKLILLLIWSFLCIVISMLLLVLTFTRSMPIKMARTIWAPGVFFIFGSKLKVSGLENIERGKTYIIMANHLSYLDIPSMFRALPLDLYFIAKKELKKTPFLGWYMMAVGMIFIDRKDPRKAQQSLKDAAEYIQGGKNVLIFPEGTISVSGETMKFKKGGFHLALESGVEILPVALNGTNKIWPGDSNTNLKRGQVQVTVGKPISVKNFLKKDLSKLITEVQEKVEVLI